MQSTEQLLPVSTWSLNRLLQHVAEYRPDLTQDSRKVSAGCVFVAMNGSHTDGGRFIPDAVAGNAAFIVCEPHLAQAVQGAVAVPVDNPRAALARLAAALHNTNALPFILVGVTGTNGKTTTTYLLEHLFRQKSAAVGVIGTIAQRWPNHHTEAAMTTPDCVELHAMLASMADAGVTLAAMEVSSHALDQSRVAEIPFGGAVFTNLTQDHLDYHHTFEAYYTAKARLFLSQPRPDKAMAVCTDDAFGRRLAADILSQYNQSPSCLTVNLITYGLKPFEGKSPRHLSGQIMESSRQGLHLRMSSHGQACADTSWEIRSPLVGAFNAENLLATQAMGLGLGFTPDDFSCFKDFQGVPGRLERIPNEQGLDVFVDFAHTPDALKNVLTALRNSGFERIICVFGCGGDRDKTKRPLMGEAVAQGADVAVLTSDNPRNEAPLDIMADVMPGLTAPSTASQVLCEPDRRMAMAKALEILRTSAKHSTALLVAGKGHETTQQIGDVKHPFSDQQTLRELLNAPQY